MSELESLLARPPAAAGTRNVPVLDELASPEGGEPSAGEAPADARAAEIAKRIEARVASELSDLAGVILAVVRRCIFEELRVAPPRTGPGQDPPAARPASAPGTPRKDAG